MKKFTDSFALRFLKCFCPDHLYEEIEGDLIQKFNRDVKVFGARKAERRLIWNVVRFLRPGIMLRNKLQSPLQFDMLASYFTFSLRNIQRHKVFSLINIAGLALGMMLCLLISNYVLFERSYDKFIPRYQDIVRVSYSRFIDNEFQYSKAQVFPLVGEELKNNNPEIEACTKLFPINTHIEIIFSTESNGQRKSFNESAVYAVDSSFLKVFTLPLLYGDPASALTGEKKIILSESTARKYFGDSDPLNKVVHSNGIGNHVVTGVFRDLPSNSHMHFNALVSWMNVYENGGWNWDGFYNYLLLHPKTDLNKLEKSVQPVLNMKLKEVTDANRVRSDFFLQPLADIHLNSQLTGEMQPNGNAKVIDALQIVVVIIMGLAFINYINLSIARGIRRSKEISVRKIIGSDRYQLMSLFFTEAFILNLIAFGFAVVLALTLSSFFNSLAGKEVEKIIWSHPILLIIICLIILSILSLLSGFYPARLLSLINPALAVKGKVNSSISGNRPFRKSLLIIQFLATIVLTSGTLVIQQQVSFMQSQPLGFTLEQNLIIKSLAEPGAELDTTFANKLNLFKRRINENAFVTSSTITSNIPGRENEWQGRLRISKQEKEFISTFRTRVDTDFLETYGLTLIAGENFKNENPKQIILNESTVKMMGYKNAQEALGNFLMGDLEIIGVVKDFHERSLQEPISPSVFTPGSGYMKFITVRINSAEAKNTLSFLQQQWKDIFPEKPFEYFFLDEFFNNQYRQEQQLGTVFSYFSAIAISIACLGLFGFTYFMTHQRTKEIGIRKTLGASFTNLIRLLSSEFVSLLGFACLIAVPLGYFITEKWLQKYPVRIELQTINFVLPTLLVGTLTFLSISILLIRAIRTNPTEALKHE